MFIFFLLFIYVKNLYFIIPPPTYVLRVCNVSLSVCMFILHTPVTFVEFTTKFWFIFSSLSVKQIGSRSGQTFCRA